MFVEDLICQSSKMWNVPLLESLFDDETVQAIIQIDIPSSPYPDQMCWIPNRSGDFSVKSAYYTDQSPRFDETIDPNSSLLSRIWKSKLLERLKTFLWRCIVGALPTKQILATKFPIDSDCCLLCNSEVESIDHVFIHCPLARAIWFSVWGLRIDMIGIGSLSQLIEFFLDNPEALYQVSQVDSIIGGSITLEDLWKYRNGGVCESVSPKNR